MKSLESKERGLSGDEKAVLNLIKRAPAITRITAEYLEKFIDLDVEPILLSLGRRQLINYDKGEWELR